jgi:hypothetical protein
MKELVICPFREECFGNCSHYNAHHKLMSFTFPDRCLCDMGVNCGLLRKKIRCVLAVEEVILPKELFEI